MNEAGELRKEKTMTVYEQARARVENDPRLARHAKTILNDWPQDDEWWGWVVHCEVDYIVDWAREIEGLATG